MKETTVDTKDPETKDPIAELAGEINRVISDNRKFLARIMEDDFEPEEDEGEEELPEEEL